MGNLKILAYNCLYLHENHAEASDERLFSAAVPSLFIIGVSMLSVIIIHHLGKRVDL